MTNPSPLDEHLFIIGMRHSGKTAIGKLVAELISAPFADLGKLVEGVHDPAGRYSFLDILATYGDSYFRQCETEAVRMIPSPKCGKSYVVSLCERTPENRDAMSRLGTMGKIIYIRENPGLLRQRAAADGHSGKTFDTLFARLDPLYADCSWRIIEPEGSGVRETAGRILDLIMKDGGETDGQ